MLTSFDGWGISIKSPIAACFIVRYFNSLMSGFQVASNSASLKTNVVMSA